MDVCEKSQSDIVGAGRRRSDFKGAREIPNNTRGFNDMHYVP